MPFCKARRQKQTQIKVQELVTEPDWDRKCGILGKVRSEGEVIVVTDSETDEHPLCLTSNKREHLKQ